LQVTAFVLNLVPIPPLDGFGAIAPFLPDTVTEAAYAYGNYGVFLIFLCLWQVPSANRTFWGLVDGIGSTIGISLDLAYDGLRMFQFWKH
jgi:Zn-dependent protease